jgi:ribosomal protein S18 acetylase RimI-like enzyme
MDSGDLPVINVAEKADERRVIDTLVLAFSADPVARWFYPDASEYLNYYPEFIKRYGGRAFENGTAYYVEDFSAAALWLPPDVHPDEEGLIALLEDTLPRERRERAWPVFEKIDSYLPSEPFWHLPHIGVDPAKQRRGAGSALLKHSLDQIDQDGAVAYLESSNPENTSLYVRYRFKTLGTVHDETIPPISPMVREAIT